MDVSHKTKRSHSFHATHRKSLHNIQPGEAHPILKAAMYNRLDQVKEILIEDPRAVLSKELDGWTVAHWAAQRGYEELLSFIADRAPQLLTTPCNAGAVPAHYAASNGHNHIISFLMERDPSCLMVQDRNGNTPAHDATDKNKLFVLKLLIQCSPALIYGANHQGLRPIDLARREEIRQFLKEAEKASMVPAVQMQNMARESKQMTAMNAVLALYCKHNWTSDSADDVQKSVFSKVAPDAQELSLITNEFGRTMSRAQLGQVLRVENHALLDAFLKRRRALKKELDQRWVEASMECWLFYSQSEGEDLEAVCSGIPGKSFRKKIGHDDAVRFGKGIYFVKEASYADDHLAAGANGFKRLLICRVILGRTNVGKPDAAPPTTVQLPGRSPVTAHALVDDAEDPLTFVLPELDDAMAYPAYLVTYKMN